MSEYTNHNNYSERLKQAVNSVETPPFLEARILSQIRVEAAAKPQWMGLFRWAPIASAAGIVLAAVIAYQLGHLRFTAESQESYVATVSNQIATLMRVGLGDHIHCAVFRRSPNNPPPVAKFIQDLGPVYAGLLPVVQQQVPPGYRMTGAHQCTYHRRKFVHLTLEGDGKLVSLVIARKQGGESFQTEAFLPALVNSGIPIYKSGVQRFAMHAFESRDHLVYVVSDMPQQRNQELMIAMAPAVREFLNKLEL